MNSLVIVVCSAYAVAAFALGTAVQRNYEPAVLTFLLAAFEEWVFRRWLLRFLGRSFPMWGAIVISSVIFAACHQPSSPPALTGLLMGGFFSCWIYRYTRLLWPAIAFHGAHNIVKASCDSVLWKTVPVLADIAPKDMLGLASLAEITFACAVGIALLLRRDGAGRSILRRASP